MIRPDLIGNERVLARVERMLETDRLPHALILEGPEGSGRRTLARYIAQAAACTGEHRPCGACAACRLGEHNPDITELSVDKTVIPVDAVRQLRSDAYIKATRSAGRVFNLPDAQRMNPQAQNALLISLEEPPPFAVFFLLTQDAQALLETVRSRSPIIRMEKLTPERIGEFLAGRPELKDNPLRAEKIKEICMMSAPSAGRALELVSLASSKSAAKDGEEKRKHAAAFCTALICGSHADILDAVRAFPKGRDNVRDILLLCGDALRDVMTSRCAPGAGTLFFTSADDAATLARKTTAARLSSLFSAIDEYAELLRRNANETVVTTLLCML